MRSVINGYMEEMETYGEQFSETPFAELHPYEHAETVAERYDETLRGNWEFSTPFLPGESLEAGETEGVAAEVATFSEVLTEMKDTLFREALEQLADEALEAHADQLAGEYGDHESRALQTERLLNEHFEPLAAEAEAMLDRFFERVEEYEAEALTDMEIGRMASEVMPSAATVSPASEQFLGGLLRKAGKLVSGAVNLAKKGVAGAVQLAGKGLAAVGKLALGPILNGLKKLAGFLLKHVVKFALDHIPPSLRPLAQKLSDKLFQAIEGKHEAETQAYEQSEGEALPAAADASRLEAEFDVAAAQLLMASDETEADHLVNSYGEGENETSALPALDAARKQLVSELARMQPGDSAQPVMEQFVPAALWPIAKTALAIFGRSDVVSRMAGVLSGLMKPLIGAEPAKLLAPAIADAGLRLFGLETGGGLQAQNPRIAAAEALAATVEETVNTVAQMPTHVLANETLLSDAVHEAFENAAAAYFPNSAIKPELRESVEHHGMWNRVPGKSGEKRYARYSDSLPVEIHPRVASTVQTFGGNTLNDHLRDHHGAHDGKPFKGKVTVYQALPGTRGSTIARAEGFPASHLHPLTPHAAGALLGPNAAMGRHTPGRFMHSPQKLHVNQRLYRIEPEHGRRHHHARLVHSELLINLLRGEIRIWLYLSEPLCQKVSAEFAKGGNGAAPFKRMKQLVRRAAEALKLAISHHHLPPEILVVSETPNLSSKPPHWLKQVGHHLSAKISEWADTQIAQYLRNSPEDFKRACASHHDGVTLRITMTNVPGLELLRQISEGNAPAHFSLENWPKGAPAFQVIARPGHAINRLRD